MVRRAPQYDPRGYDEDDITGSAPPRRVEREPFYQPNPWGARDPYERSTRMPPPFFGPGRPFGY
jgi:hypothetical protein